MIRELSVTKWEISEFGGYKKLLTDYPEIKLDWDVEYDLPEKMDKVLDLGYYASSKLVKLFLLKIKEHALIDSLLGGAKKDVVEVWSGRKNVVMLNKDSIKMCVARLAALESELKNLFNEYADVLSRTDIYYELPDPSKKSKGEGSGNEGDEESKGKEGEDGDKSLGLRDYIAMMRAALENTKEKGAPSGLFLGNDYIGGNLSQTAKFIYPEKYKREVDIDNEDLKYANHLADVLDISFDPQSDKIHNVRTGKIDPHKIAEIVPGATHIYYRVEENQTTKPFSVCILGDESGSMGGENIINQVRLIKILYSTFIQILPPEKIYIYGHSDGYTYGSPGIYVYNDRYNHTFKQTIGRMCARGSNYDGPVIEAVYRKVREHTQDNIIFISISDGQPAGAGYGGQMAIDDMKRIIEKCKRDGFVTIGIGFRYGGVREIYNYNTIISDFREMVKRVSGIVNKVVKTEFQT